LRLGSFTGTDSGSGSTVISRRSGPIGPFVVVGVIIEPPAALLPEDQVERRPTKVATPPRLLA
jgi:hypothetical protein